MTRKDDGGRGPRRRREKPETRLSPAVAAAIVIVSAIMANLLILKNGFTQDDLALLVESDRLQGPGSWKEILSLPYWPPPAAPDLYRPVLSLLLALQNSVGDGSALVFRVISLGLHALVSVALLGMTGRVASGPAAMIGAIWFAVHPVHVEALTLGVGQGELLVGLFSIAASLLYLGGRLSDSGRPSPRAWAAIAALYALAAFSKENGFVLPGLLLASEILVPAGSRPRPIRNLWPGFAGLALVGIGAFILRTVVLRGAIAASFSADAIANASIVTRALTMLRIVPEWIRLLLFPVHLRAEYSPQEFVASTGFGGRELLGLVLVAAVGAVVILARRAAPLMAFGLVWTAVALLPVSNLVLPTGVLIAERTLYLPSVGVALIWAGVLEIAWRSVAREPARRLVIAGATVGVVLLAARSALRSVVWRDTRTLTLASVRDAPRSWRVQQAYGEQLFADREFTAAHGAYARAIELAPERWRVRNRYAGRLWEVHADGEALAQLQQSLVESPGRIETLMRIPAALLALGRYPEARQLADSIIRAVGNVPVMEGYRLVADSAIKLNAPPGSVRIFPSR